MSATNKRKFGCVIYLRVSSAKQAEPTNLDQQQMVCRDYAGQQGLTVVRVFIDGGKTGTNTNRKAFQEMLTFCHQHRKELGAVVCYDVSRWSRDVAGWATTLHTLDGLGIDFHSVLERTDRSSASGKYVANINAASSQHFSDLLGEKMKNVQRHRLSLGMFPWKAPIGYRNLVHGRDARPASGANIVQDTVTAPLIAYAFNAVAAGLRSVEDVRKDCNAQGLRTAKGHEVARQSFYNLIRNPLYAGWVESGDVRVRGIHEPIVTQETFDAVQEMIREKNPEKKPYRKTRDDFPLRQFVACAVCGRGLTAGYNRGRKERYAFYFCYVRTCRGVSIRAEELHRLFKELLALHQPTEEAIRKGLPELAASRWAAQREGLAHKAGKLSQRQRDIQAMCNGALEKLLHGSITEQQYKSFVEPNEREAADITERLAALEKARATLDEITEQVRAEAIDLAGTWERASLDDKLDLQRSLFGRYLYFEPERGQGFLNQRNTLLMKMWSDFTSTIPTDTDWIEKLQAIKSDPEDEDCKVGVSDGV
jgi:site-specific DNA recombinase